jgi:hypothetical protein
MAISRVHDVTKGYSQEAGGHGVGCTVPIYATKHMSEVTYVNTVKCLVFTMYQRSLRHLTQLQRLTCRTLYM